MNPLLAEGLTDAAGLVGGVLIAYGIGTLLGFDPMAAGYQGSAIAGIGGGVGLQLARRLRAGRKKKAE
jgi:hypothetical protein